jgi:glutathione S-transferase
MPQVEIFGIERSNYVRMVRMVCEEKGITYDLKPVPPHSPEVLAIHPFGRIPVMRHGDVTLCESKAIATYLDRSFPGPALMPSGARDAALAEQWISLVNTVIDRTLVRTYMFHYIFPKTADGKPDRAAIDAVEPEMRRQIALLDKAVARTGHLAGDQFSLADINIMPILYWLRHYPESADALAGTMQLAAYYDHHAARDSFKKTMPPPLPQQMSQGQSR